MTDAPDLFDTHAHLHDPALAHDLDAVIERARDAGIGGIVTIGTDIATSRDAVALAQQHTSVWATVGLHPHDAKDWTPDAEAQLRRLAGSDRVVAVGEIGLDFFRNLSPRDDQFRAFREQLDLADDFDLPVVIHSRDAHDDTYSVLADWTRRQRRDTPVGVIHCFSGDADLARRYWQLGFLVSFAGPVTYPKNDALRAAAAALPADAIVLETDCPYLAPQARRGKRNEPALIRHSADAVAAVRGDDLADLARTSTANALRLFRLPTDGAGIP